MFQNCGTNVEIDEKHENHNRLPKRLNYDSFLKNPNKSIFGQ